MLVHRFAPIPPNGSALADGGVGGHAYSLDGLVWHYDNLSDVAYTADLTWRANGSTTRAYRRERPQPLIGADGHLARLYNGVWPCHVGAADDDSRDAAIGCESFTVSTVVGARVRSQP